MALQIMPQVIYAKRVHVVCDYIQVVNRLITLAHKKISLIVVIFRLAVPFGRYVNRSNTDLYFFSCQQCELINMIVPDYNQPCWDASVCLLLLRMCYGFCSQIYDSFNVGPTYLLTIKLIRVENAPPTDRQKGTLMTQDQQMNRGRLFPFLKKS